MPSTRRTFLTSLGAAVLAQRVGLRRASAAAPRARRLIVCTKPNGVTHAWRPSGQGSAFTFAPESMFGPLQDVARHLTVVDGVDFAGASNHDAGTRAMLAGRRDVSIDQHVAHTLRAATSIRTLELGVQTRDVPPVVRAPAGVVLAPACDPADVFERLFPGPTEDVERVGRLRRSILDLHRAELAELRARVGPSERRKLEIHLEALRATEQSLDEVEGPRCTAPNAPPAVELLDDADFDDISRAQIDLMVAALQCDLTRVVTLQWGQTAGTTLFSWLNAEMGHHNLSHVDDRDAAGMAQRIRVEQWFAEQFAGLVRRLAALPEPSGGGSMLDHSILLFTTELGDSRTHACTNMPMILAGGGAGVLSPGHCVRAPAGTAHNGVLNAICRAMGVDDDVYDEPGDGFGPLAGVLA